MKIKELEREIDRCITTSEKLKEKLRDRVSRKFLTCSCCSKKTQIKKLSLIALYHYIPPSGCMEGAYWTFSNEYKAYCPKCTGLTRYYATKFDDNLDSTYKFVNEHRDLFKECLKWYTDSNLGRRTTFESNVELIEALRNGDNYV